MLYIISGASRSGKTIMAQKLAVQKGIPYLSLDWIMMGFTNGIPEYGIHDKLFPDDIARRLWSFLRAMLESMLHLETDCIIEGEAVLPELIIEIYKEHPDKLRICFLGFTEVNMEQKLKEIRDFSKKKNDWLADESDTYIKDHVINMVAHSRMIKESCKKHKLTYVDTSKKFLDAMDETITFLTA